MCQFSRGTGRVGLSGDFVALEKLRRLVFIRFLHQHGFRELQRLRSSGIS